MRVAFVGKGGTGKSTLSTLFFLHLLSNDQKVLLFDADLNIHIPDLLGVSFPEEKSLSLTNNTAKIRKYLRGKSTFIRSIDDFYKTTPPSNGVNLLTLEQTNPLLKECTEPYKQGYISVVGTYEKDEIGRSCYHTNLSILENLLSFASLKENEWIIADMVAGIDAFSNTFHKQFDALILIIEPTQESVAVYRQYLSLATHAGIADRLLVVGNNVEDQDDLEFLKTAIQSSSFIGHLPHHRSLKKKRQRGEVLDTELLKTIGVELFNTIEKQSRKMKIDPEQRLKELHQLHLHYIQQDYVKNASGDLSHQIDKQYRF